MKLILVTGGNKGIGQAIVKRLLEDYADTQLLLGSRDVPRGEAAKEQIIQQLGESARGRVEVLQIDVTSDESVNKAVETVVEKYGATPLYGLVNNAGGVPSGFGPNSNAREILDLNTYGLRRVCEAFLPLIQKEKGRIVQISSGAAPMFVTKCSDEMKEFFVSRMTWDQIESTVIKPFLEISENASLDDDAKLTALEKMGLSPGGMGAYGLSKACVNSYTLTLSARAPSLLINSCSPGFIETDLTRPFAERQGKAPAAQWARMANRGGGPLCADMGMLPVEKGAISCLYLMMADLEGEIAGYESGRYYGSDAKRSALHKTRNPGDPVYQGEFP